VEKVNCVLENVAKPSFQAIAVRSDQEVPFWFAEGKNSLIRQKRANFQVNTKGKSLVLTPYTSGSRLVS